MPASAFQIPDASFNITYLVPEPFEPKPLIADILRTQFCVPDSIFLVEDVDIAHTSRSKRWRAIRLLLGDGELCIQALLSPGMHPFVDRGDVDFGSYVKLEQFRVEWRDISNKQPRRIVYLIVDSLVVVGWNNALVDSLAAEELQTEDHAGPADMQRRRTPDTDQSRPREPVSDKARTPEPQCSMDNQSGYEHEREETAELEADDDFESMPISETRASQKRRELATTTTTTAATTPTTMTRQCGISRNPPSHPAVHTAPANPSNLPWASSDPTRPLKLTNLRSIPNLPYKQNWSVNVLCVVSAISDVEPAGIPPYTQRQARLTDPSTDKHVLLTVFLDPELFVPKVGSVVLLLGVKNHRFDGGSLKKYESDRQRTGSRWWYENPSHLAWCDVDGLRQWWAESAV